MFLNNLYMGRGASTARRRRTQSPKALPLPLPECTRLCSRIDAISIIITGAGSPLK